MISPQQDHAQVTEGHQSDLGGAVTGDEVEIQQRGGQDHHVEQQHAEELARDHLRLGDRCGHEGFHRAAAELLGEAAHGQQGQQEDQHHGHHFKERAQRGFTARGQGDQDEVEPGSQQE